MSENHKEALWRLNKIIEDTNKSKDALDKGDFKTAYSFYTRIEETVRLIRAEGNLKQSDTDVLDRERIAKDSK